MDGDARHTGDSPSPEQLQALYRLTVGFRVSQAIKVVVELGIADLLGNDPKSTEELANATGSHANSLFRVLRFLAGVGLFTEEPTRCFILTPLGAGLRADVPGSIRPIAREFVGEAQWKAWGELLRAVRAGEPAFDLAHDGMTYFEYLESDPDAADIFNVAMTGNTARSGDAMMRVYDWSGIKTVVDVGGGQGYLLATILQGHPEMRGVLLDRPKVVAQAKALLEERGVADRCQIFDGNFFVRVPAGGDAYVLRNVIHDWNDQDALAILGRCRDAMPDSGKVLVVERVVGSDYRELSPVLNADLAMLVLGKGRERTEAEFRTLFSQAGFRLTRVLPLEDGPKLCVLEGVQT